MTIGGCAALDSQNNDIIGGYNPSKKAEFAEKVRGYWKVTPSFFEEFPAHNKAIEPGRKCYTCHSSLKNVGDYIIEYFEQL